MKNIIRLYENKQTVFDIKDIMRITGETSYNNCKASVANAVKQGYIARIRQGVFVKKLFSPKELACKLYTPSYISFETVLFEHKKIFQPDNTIYLASYLSRTITIDSGGQTYSFCYRKLKDDLLYDTQGVDQCEYYMQASVSRAKTDMLYLKPDFYFDRD